MITFPKPVMQVLRSAAAGLNTNWITRFHRIWINTRPLVGNDLAFSPSSTTNSLTGLGCWCLPYITLRAQQWTYLLSGVFLQVLQPLSPNCCLKEPLCLGRGCFHRHSLFASMRPLLWLFIWQSGGRWTRSKPEQQDFFLRKALMCPTKLES